MSSRFGPRPVGTDGSDFSKRQLIAQHYKDSVTYKFRLKCVFLFHLLIFIPVATSLLEDVLDWIQIDWGPLENLHLPDAEVWEWWWACSVISIVLGLASMPRNRETLMRWSYYGLFLLGLMPVSVGAGTLFPQLMDYIRNPQYEDYPSFRGFPLVVLRFMFFVVALQIHGFSMYFELQLIKAWKPVTGSQGRRAGQSVTNGPAKEASKEH